MIYEVIQQGSTPWPGHKIPQQLRFYPFYVALFGPCLSFLAHVPGVPLVGVELYGSLTYWDEVDMPATQDGESNGHTKAHKPLEAEH